MTPLDILEIPRPDAGPMMSRIEAAFDGMRRSYLFRHALEMDIFERMGSEMSLEKISGELGADIGMMRMFCDALVSEGLLISTGGGYVNSPTAATYLTRSSPNCIRHSFERTLREIDGWHSLGSILRDGPKTIDRSQFFDERWIRSIASTALCGNVQKVTSEISEVIDLTLVRRMLDIGGGHGLYSIAFSARNPHMDVYVFDLPEMVSVASEHILHYNADRVHVMAGNFTKDDIGSDYDLIFSSFNPSGSDLGMIPVLRDALTPEGWLVIRQFTEAARNDAVANLGWNFFDFNGDRRPRRRFSGPDTASIDDYNSALVEAGFRPVHRWSFDEVSDITVMRKMGV